MTSLLRLQRLSRCPSLSFTRGMGSYATFKVPPINNEPNVSIHTSWLKAANDLTIGRKHMRLALQTGKPYRMPSRNTSITPP